MKENYSKQNIHINIFKKKRTVDDYVGNPYDPKKAVSLQFSKLLSLKCTSK